MDQQPQMDFFECCLVGIPLLLFVKFSTVLPPWGNRKLLHMGVGAIALTMDTSDVYVRTAVYSVTMIAIVLGTCLPLFPFSTRFDIGIYGFLFFCSFALFYDIPLINFAPLFFADPMGAVVGRNLKTVKLVGDKSIAGSLAVAVVAFLTLHGGSYQERAIKAISLSLVELVTGKLDNLCIGILLATWTMETE